MSLKQRLIEEKPRETSGSRVQNRFDYQLHWALCHLLELHESGRDYVLVLEFHDDVLVLDSATDPSTVIFYQVKTLDNGMWKRADLTERKKSKAGSATLSFLGKLYGNFLRFPDHTEALCFVSNAGFSVKLSDGTDSHSKDSIPFSDLHLDEQAAVLKAIRTEHGLTAESKGVVRFKCIKSHLSLHDQDNHSLGRLTAFLERLPDTETSNVAAFFRVLKEEIRRSSKKEQLPQSFEELCKFRSIGRLQFNAMLDRVRSEPARPNWSELIRHRLDVEGVSFPLVSNIHGQVTRYLADRTDPTNTLLEDAQRVLLQHVPHALHNHSRLSDAIESILVSVRGNLIELIERRGENYVRAMIGVLLNEEPELSTTAPNVEDEAT